MCENAWNLKKFLTCVCYRTDVSQGFGRTEGKWVTPQRLPDNRDISTLPATLDTFLTTPLYVQHIVALWNNIPMGSATLLTGGGYVTQEDGCFPVRDLMLRVFRFLHSILFLQSTLECSRVEWVIVCSIWPLTVEARRALWSVLFQELDIIILSKCEGTPLPILCLIIHIPC